ncbi:MAG: hypothetical protein WAR37_03210 [Candidatus Microsaccharimonas sp.]
MSIFINEQTKRVLDKVFKNQPHALLLSGPVGVGTRTVLDSYLNDSQQLLISVLPEKDEKVDLEKGTVTVESIRRLYDTSRTIEPRSRTIIIDYAERMAVPAQNAFLKLLEEPPHDTRFILLSHEPARLLPTIRSRVQEIALRPITTAQSQLLLDTLGVNDQTLRSQLLFIADGLPAELTRLAQNPEQFSKRAAIVRDARQLVQGSSYERLVLAKKYKDTRADASMLLQDAAKQLSQTIMKNSSAKLLVSLEKIITTHASLQQQGNIRLQLSNLVVLS